MKHRSTALQQVGGNLATLRQPCPALQFSSEVPPADSDPWRKLVSSGHRKEAAWLCL